MDKQGAILTNSVNHQFSRWANDYDRYNIIQQIVSKALIRELNFQPKRILELGCGSGQVFKNIKFNFDYYKAIDFSYEMCNIHPKNKNLEIYCLDFDSDAFYNNIKNDQKYDIVLSSSALQWSKDLKKIIKILSTKTDYISMVLFTSNTFKTIFELSNSISPILTVKEIKDSFDQYFDISYEIVNYKVQFSNKKELFNYIKKSGVSGENKLSFKNAKNLYKNYKLDYLEFEVIFIKGNTKL